MPLEQGKKDSKPIPFNREEELKKAIEIAKKADVVLLYVGTTLGTEAEGLDRKTLGLPGNQEDLVKAIMAVNPKTVVVEMNAGPLAVPWIKAHVPAMIEAWWGGIGVVCFGLVLVPLWWLLSKRAKRAVPALPSAIPRLSDRLLLAAAALLALVLHGRAPQEFPLPLNSPPPTEFTFNGLTLPLQPLPPSPAETAFAASFPGSLSSHRWGDAQVILRRVTTATRRLHPSRDCLRAAGYDTTDAITVRGGDGTEWARFTATRGEVRLIVHERIVSEQDGSTWTDVPAWFWSALRHPLNAPWRAETVILE